MAAGGKRVSAASARAHTRQSNSNSNSGLLKKLLLLSFVGLLAWGYQAIRPPPPKICGTPDGPPITAPRIKLSDGRHLAYKEIGVPKDEAKYKFIYIHAFDAYRNRDIGVNLLSPETIENLGIYIVAFDRPGYGESDPHPNQTLKSFALDVEEFADKLGLGEKFYLIGFSMGGQGVWKCLKYIPHRLAGATLLAPVINFWWSGLPSNLSAEAFSKQLQQDRWALRVSHYVPWLTYWWNTQKIFPSLSVIAQHGGNVDLTPIRQQGEFESLHRDANVGFSKWEFDPTELTNPFPNNEGTVHLWQGDEDFLVPATLQRSIVNKLPWVHYHELSGSGHMFPLLDGMCDTIIKTQLSVEK